MLSNQKNIKILAVDDEPFNLDIIMEHLSLAGFEVITAQDGLEALKALESNTDLDGHTDISAIILDRMMPNMDGMQVLQKIKADPRFSNIPVIMQTAAAATEQVIEGIKAGVYYYLTKPYQDVILLRIVNAALLGMGQQKEVIEEIKQHKRSLGKILMDNGKFNFRTPEEVKNLVYFIANCAPDPGRASYGLSQIMTNAIEHGNLGIGYEEKKKHVLAGTLSQEIERRLNLPENKDKNASISFKVMDNGINIIVSDQGKGFNWKEYIDMSPDRATDPNGRGIATAKAMSFASIDYIGCGNEVSCIINI